jgi:hypothetical protein
MSGMSDPAPDRARAGSNRGAALRLVVDAALLVGVMTSSGARFVLSLAGLAVSLGWSGFLTLREWWRSGTTGRPPGVPAEWIRPGDVDVVIESRGTKPIYVIKHIRDITGLDLALAKKIVDDAPSSVLRSVSTDTAERARSLLESAGATVSLQPSAASPVTDPS